VNYSLKNINKFLIISLVVGLFLGGTPNSLRAQSELNSLSFVDSEDNKVTLPFKFISNLIIIPVLINNSDSLYFILDTGLNISILTELSMGDSLSLNYTKQVKLSGLGKGDPINALHSYGNTFRISSVKGNYQHIYIILQNVFNLSSMLGTRVHGLIGYNLFKEFVVELNFEKKEITLHRPESYRLKHSRKSKIIPIILDNTKPYIYATVRQVTGEEVRVKLLLDTGASHSLWLDTQSDPDLHIPDEVRVAYLGTGLNGEINGKMGRIKEFTLGDFTFESPIVAYPDSSSASSAFGLDGRNGSLGSEILRRFHVVIDYPHSQIILRPNKYYKEQFKLNRTGIEVVSPIPGFPYYTVSSIRKDSPGYYAGLKAGDILYSINHRTDKNLSINHIYEYFQGKPGRKLKVVVIRNNLKFVTYLYLEKFI